MILLSKVQRNDDAVYFLQLDLDANKLYSCGMEGIYVWNLYLRLQEPSNTEEKEESFEEEELPRKEIPEKNLIDFKPIVSEDIFQQEKTQNQLEMHIINDIYQISEVRLLGM